VRRCRPLPAGINHSDPIDSILIFRTDESTKATRLETETFDNVNKAIIRLEELEKSLEDSADIVLVRADSEASVRDAFRNYFSDTIEFVRLISEGRNRLLK
jgi:putative GTP pyrophosphokinase